MTRLFLYVWMKGLGFFYRFQSCSSFLLIRPLLSFSARFNDIPHLPLAIWAAGVLPGSWHINLFPTYDTEIRAWAAALFPFRFVGIPFIQNPLSAGRA